MIWIPILLTIADAILVAWMYKNSLALKRPRWERKMLVISLVGFVICVWGAFFAATFGT